MNTTIQKWGNSYAVRLPKEIVTEKNMKEGTAVRVDSRKSGIVISLEPKKKKKVSLDILISNINNKNKHTVTEWGESKGNEVW